MECIDGHTPRRTRILRLIRGIKNCEFSVKSFTLSNLFEPTGNYIKMRK